MQKRLYEEAAFYQIPAPPPNSLTDLGVEVPTDEHLRNIKAYSPSHCLTLPPHSQVVEGTKNRGELLET